MMKPLHSLFNLRGQHCMANLAGHARKALIGLGIAWLAVHLQAHAAPKAGAPVVLRHWLWDANQRPLYQQCAKDFEAAHPGTRIRIQQMGWDEYWMGLATGFISGTAPDVFTNHLARYAEYVVNGVMLDLAPLVARDAVPTDIYEPGLYEMWGTRGPGPQALSKPSEQTTGSNPGNVHERQQWALPLDWDTIALAVNLDHLKRAGVSLDQLRAANWNPQDGGSFGHLIQRLSLDAAGRRPGEAGFDRQKMAVWGYQNPGAGGLFGQTEWSHFAVSAGWRYQRAPWDPALRYEAPELAATFQWLARLPELGVSASPEVLGRMGADALFLAGRLAMVPSGAWMVGHFARHARFAHTWVALPIGPTGKRASMRNGLGLSIWAGTAHKEAAWAWVRHVGSPACQSKVAQAGVVYPALKGAAQQALAAQQRLGVDATAFWQALQGEASLTFAPPVVRQAAEANSLLTPVFERVLAGRAKASEALPAVAKQVLAVTSRP